MKTKQSPEWLDCFDSFDLLMGAFCYYLGRRTATVDSFARELATAWPRLPDRTRLLIRRDLEEAFVRDDEARAREDNVIPLGHDCDRESWERVRDAWLKEDQTKQKGEL